MKTMNLVAVIQAPLSDKHWLRKLLLIGLLGCVPLFGAVNLIGWVKATARRSLAGDEGLPPANFSHLSDGFALVFSMLPVFALVWLVQLLALFTSSGASLLGPNLTAVLHDLSYAAKVLVLPAMIYRHVIHDDPVSSVRFGKLVALIKGHPMPYLTMVACMALAQFVGDLGSHAFFIGLLFTLPLASALHGFACAEFARATDRA